AVDGVVAPAAKDDVIPPIAVDLIVAVVRTDTDRYVGSDKSTAVRKNNVVAAAPVDLVAAELAVNDVISRAAENVIVSSAAMDDGVARADFNGVVAGAAFDVVGDVGRGDT